MKRYGIRRIVCTAAMMVLGVVLLAGAKTLASTKPVNEAAIRAKVGGIQIPFIENKGQADKQVAYYANTFSGMVFVTKNGNIVYGLPRVESQKDGKVSKTSFKSVSLKEQFVGAKIKLVKGIEKAITKANCFIGRNPRKWKKNLSTYNLVSLGEIYKGINLRLRAHGNSVEKLFYVSPGADPNKIRVKIGGAKALTVNKQGELELDTELGKVKFTKPVAYQEKNGKREYVKVSYVVNSKEYGFRVENYDRKKALVIDPLLASTYLGRCRGAYSLAIDAEGNVFVVGYTYSSANFPTTPGAYNTTHNGDSDVFVSKLNSDLSCLLSSTFLGGSNFDGAYAITINTRGEILVAGRTSSANFPTTSNAYDITFTGYYYDAFVSKLNSDLSCLLASTFLGGSNFDGAYALDTDASGNVFVVGYTTSTDFPTTPNAYDPTKNSDSYYKYYSDVFISKLSPDLSSLFASTYLGGRHNEAYGLHPGRGVDMMVDNKGNVVVTGYTESNDFPTTEGAYDNIHNGGYDAFVSKLNSDLSCLLASTFLGGSNFDGAYALSMDDQGNIFVVGFTYSRDFPTTAGAYDTTFNGYHNDAFVSKLSSDLSHLLASTFLGGSEDEVYHLGAAIAIDNQGSVFVTGSTSSSDFPTTPDAYDDTFNGGYDPFVSELDTNLSQLLFSTYLGGGQCEEFVQDIAINDEGQCIVTGYTESSDFPITPSAYDTTTNTYNAFISKLSSNPSANSNSPPGITSFTVDPSCGGAPLTVTFSCSGHDSDGYVDHYTIDFGDGDSDTTNSGSISHTYDSAGTYTATCVAVDDDGDESSSRSVTISVTSSGGGGGSGRAVPSQPTIVEVSPADAWLSMGPDAADGVLTSGENTDLVVNFPSYQGVVDIYAALWIPPQWLLLIDTNNQFVLFNGNFPPFRVGVTSEFNYTFFEDLPISNSLTGECLLPNGTYGIYMIVVPSGTDLNSIDWTNDPYLFEYYLIEVKCSQFPK